MNTQTKEKVKYEIVQEGCFWAVYEVRPDGSMKKVTEAIYNHGAAKSLADRLNG